ncbi:MAG: NAD-dependent epimerase/dehydratase family protein [Planctomycetes bacterium]|nr:NAD-dependent epimerase/dehydratase family protein [Planctomycetota bacterium]NOG53607.1 NAD(P)H-binding protein [Planctomycetota bacterium]
MAHSHSDVVTGAFSYTGTYITARLLQSGRAVRTLTSRPDSDNPFDAPVPTLPYCFDDPDRLAESLSGTDTLYNTYWVRFSHGQRTFVSAVENTKILFRAAVAAGVRRIVHVSISNPSAESPFPYFSGKAHLENDLQSLDVSHAIIRPTVVFGDEDILINNIAWLVRRLPIFLVPGDGQYQMQPVHADDLARVAVEAGTSDENKIVNAVGPETYPFIELVRLIAKATDSTCLVGTAPAGLSLFISKLVGLLMRDVVLTRDELGSLMANLLIVPESPITGDIKLSEWLAQNKETVGSEYSSELGRHYRR